MAHYKADALCADKRRDADNKGHKIVVSGAVVSKEQRYKAVSYEIDCTKTANCRLFATFFNTADKR